MKHALKKFSKQILFTAILILSCTNKCSLKDEQKIQEAKDTAEVDLLPKRVNRNDLQKEIVQLKKQLETIDEQIKKMSNQIKRRSRPVAIKKLKRQAGQVQERIEKIEGELSR
ncbi:MAG TPA: hypothetical protein VHO47_01300 [Candidatus Babeliales bacterium]|nr:hypothetical protein [Candidatus Babeliales bacterium]